MLTLTTTTVAVMLFVVLMVWIIVTVKIDDAIMARSMDSATPEARRNRPFGGTREIARRAHQLARGIIRVN